MALTYLFKITKGWKSVLQRCLGLQILFSRSKTTGLFGRPQKMSHHHHFYRQLIKVIIPSHHDSQLQSSYLAKLLQYTLFSFFHHIVQPYYFAFKNVSL